MNRLQLQQPDRGERRGLAAALAGGVHVVLIGLLVFGMQWQVKRDEPVSVELWSSLPKPSQPVETPKPRVEPKIKPKPAPEPEPEPVAVKKPDIALKQEKPKPKPEPKPEPKHEEKPEPKKPEPKKPEPKPEPKPPEPKPKAESKPEKPAKPVDRAAELAKLADEFSSSVKPSAAAKPGPSAAEVAHAKARGEYGDAVRNRVERNVIPPADSRVSNKAVFEVTLLPSMEVLRVVKRSGSGNAAYDDAVERAILKTSPFPPLPDGLSFHEVRTMVLAFRP